MTRRKRSIFGTYFGEAAGEYRHARFYLMRQILHLAYAALLMLLGSGGKAIEPDSKAPGFRDFHTAFGRVKSVWPPLIRNCSTPGFI